MHVDTPSPSRSQVASRGRYTGLLRIGMGTIVSVSALSRVPTAAAHDGATHTGTPHWGLLAVILAGFGILGGSVLLGRTRWKPTPQRTVGGLLLGLIVTMVGTIGIVQIQVEPVGTTPVGRQWYPLLSALGGGVILSGSLVLDRFRWPNRPLYTGLGMVLGLWVAYPILVPGSALTHPLGYLLVVSVPLVVGYLLWREVWPAITTSLENRLARWAGSLVTTLFVVFFLFSAGLFSVTPDTGTNMPTTAFVTSAQFSDPLVMWPAVEFYLPSIPLAGALSVGTALLIAVLAGLIGVNTVLATEIWIRDLQVNHSGGVVGAVATTGATACCCCGPAVYAIASAVLGVSASPLYWAFVAPSSPIGALFLVGALALLTGSAIQLADSIAAAGVCDRRIGTS